MKETLRERLLSEINKLDKRCESLMHNIQLYKEDNEFERAMVNDIKWRQLKMVSQSLKKIL
jgi:hypothetical protein